MNQCTDETNGGFHQPASLLGFRVHLGSPLMTSLTSDNPIGIRAASSSAESRSPRMIPLTSGSPASLARRATASGS